MAKRKQVDIQAFQEWQAYREGLKKATTIDHEESFGEKQARIKRLEADNEAWFAYYFPHISTNPITQQPIPPADFHIRSTKRVMQDRNWFECRCWSRSLAKSTRTRMEVLKLVLTGKKRNIIMVSNSWDNACRLLEPYRAELDTNQRIINDYGKQRGFSKWRIGEFVTKKGVAFRAVGADQSPRGSNENAVRPDTILIDDIDTDQDCRNPDIIKERVKWIFNALIGTREIYIKLLIIACGNIIAEYCCMTELMKKSKYNDIINIRTNGVSSWSKNSEQDIDEALEILPYSTIQQEYYNCPVTEGRIFESLTFENIPPLNTMEQLVVYGDPSTSNSESKNSSFKVVALLGRKKGITYVIKVFCKQCGQAEFIQAYYDMYTIVTTAGKTAKYWMECNSLQKGFFESFYDPEFKKISRQKHVPVYVEKDDRPKANKYTRIEATLNPPYKLGWLIFNKKEEENEHMVETIGQFKAVSPTYKGAMDAPDCIEGGYKVLDRNGGMSLSTYRYQQRSSRRY